MSDDLAAEGLKWVIAEHGVPMTLENQLGDGPWVLVHYPDKAFAVWKRTGCVYAMEMPMGPVDDDPLYDPATVIS